jgi:hypothetical protein
MLFISFSFSQKAKNWRFFHFKGMGVKKLVDLELHYIGNHLFQPILLKVLNES